MGQDKKILTKGAKLNIMHNRAKDEVYTPDIALELLLPHIKKEMIIYECAVGTGKLKDYFENKGYRVVSGSDFFTDNITEFDIIITNPPYSLKDKFLEKCYLSNKPFALLLPITALEGRKRQKLYNEFGLQILFPEKRIDFNGKGNVWFYTAWFTNGLNLPNVLNFVPNSI